MHMWSSMDVTAGCRVTVPGGSAVGYCISTKFRLELTFAIFVRGHEITKVCTKLQFFF